MARFIPLTQEERQEILLLYQEGKQSVKQIAFQYDCSEVTVHSVISRSGEKPNRKRVWTEEMKEFLRENYIPGNRLSRLMLMEYFGVSSTVLSGAIQRFVTMSHSNLKSAA